MRFINDSRILPADEPTEIQRRTQPPEDIVSLVQMVSSDGKFKREGFWSIAVEALQNIDIRGELYIDYCSEYSFA